MKSFCTIRSLSFSHIMRKKILTNYILQTLIFIIHKEVKNLFIKKTTKLNYGIQNEAKSFQKAKHKWLGNI